VTLVHLETDRLVIRPWRLEETPRWVGDARRDPQLRRPRADRLEPPPDSHGHGYAAEAARAVLDHGLTSGLGEIHALTHLDNEPSVRVAQRLGMRDLGTTELWYDSPSRLFIVP
jgi:RimJ/RimL family protein N-acetyltransferase